jgi:uncharacterized protein (TIGR02266 family)
MADEGGGANRRRFPRAAVSQRCWLESGEVTLYAQMANLSEGGLFLKTLAPVANGARAALRFAVGPQGEEIEAEAVVVWRRETPNGAPAGVGLEFVDLAPAHRARVRSLVGDDPIDGD